jgi:hypothetical protein
VAEGREQRPSPPESEPDAEPAALAERSNRGLVVASDIAIKVHWRHGGPVVARQRCDRSSS